MSSLTDYIFAGLSSILPSSSALVGWRPSSTCSCHSGDGLTQDHFTDGCSCSEGTFFSPWSLSSREGQSQHWNTLCWIFSILRINWFRHFLCIFITLKVKWVAKNAMINWYCDYGSPHSLLTSWTIFSLKFLKTTQYDMLQSDYSREWLTWKICSLTAKMSSVTSFLHQSQTICFCLLFNRVWRFETRRHIFLQSSWDCSKISILHNKILRNKYIMHQMELLSLKNPRREAAFWYLLNGCLGDQVTS